MRTDQKSTRDLPGHAGLFGAEPVWRRGFVLVAVLWVIVLLSAIGASFAKNAWTESRIVRNLTYSAAAEALADGGIYRGILELLDASGDEPWRTDGTPYSVAESDGTIFISLQDENGKIDLNRGSTEKLGNLLRLSGLDDDDADSLVDKIVDFRDPDDDTRPNGAEMQEYRAAGRENGPKNNDFEAVDELLRVPGITPDLYRRVRPFLTIYSDDLAFNPNSASREVLLAQPNADPNLVDDALIERAQSEPAPIAGGFSNRPENGGRRAFANEPVFTIRANAATIHGTRFIREAIVVLTPRNAKPYRVLQWTRRLLPHAVD
jgi:general secretion pathway protein K